MAIRIYNTLTREKEDFAPVHNGRVGIYLCGPTVYKPSHIGHAVGPVIFDAIRRWLEYRKHEVTLVVNITDVDDKIIEEAKNQNRTMKDLAEEIESDYWKAMEKLNVRKPTHIPRATENIKEIQEFIQKLIGKDVAYVTGGDVYFDVTKFPDYGKLSNRSIENQEAGTRKLASSDEKRHPWDFALWKSAKPDEPSWDSPWGKGRPGWHIECSAMSMKYLGETFDIHGGGMDLVFPHHENEIAQSEAATGKPFAKYWLHNGLTRVNTKKMSKSLGNVRQLRELLDEFSGETIRFFILSTHYRRPIDFADEEIQKVAKGLQTFYRLFERVEKIIGQDVYALSGMAGTDVKIPSELETLIGEFDAAMDDDFNTADAIAALYQMANVINSKIENENITSDTNNGLSELVKCLFSRSRLLGLFEKKPESKITDKLTDKLMMLIIDVRNEARKQKQFALSDMVRDKLKEIGLQLKDSKDGTTWEKLP
jgi:cysteinyl-tRNA synthetase